MLGSLWSDYASVLHKQFFQHALIASVLIGVALVARSVMARWRGGLLGAGQSGKRVLGALIVGVALLIVSGGDRTFETLVLMHSPEWLTNFTTAI